MQGDVSVVASVLLNASDSGVTRVGDTRGDNWGCHPSILPLKPGDLF